MSTASGRSRKARSKLPPHRRRVLHEICHGGHELRVPGKLPAHGLGCLRGEGFDDPLPLLLIHDHVSPFHGREVVLNRTHPHLFRSHEPVAAGGVCRPHPADIELDDTAAEQCEDPVDGPHEGEVDRAPPHGLGPGDVRDQRRQRLGKDLPGGSPGNGAPYEQVLSLGGLHRLELIHVHPLALCKPDRSLGGSSRGIVGDLHGRAGELFHRILLGVRNGLSDEHQPPRSAVGVEPPRTIDPVFGQAGLGQTSQVPQCPFQIR